MAGAIACHVSCPSPLLLEPFGAPIAMHSLCHHCPEWLQLQGGGVPYTAHCCHMYHVASPLDELFASHPHSHHGWSQRCIKYAQESSVFLASYSKCVDLSRDWPKTSCQRWCAECYPCTCSRACFCFSDTLAQCSPLLHTCILSPSSFWDWEYKAQQRGEDE